MSIETSTNFLRGQMIRARTRRVATRRHPCRPVGQGRILNEARVIMMAKGFLPKVETSFAPMVEREIKIAFEQFRHRSTIQTISNGARLTITQKRERAQRGAIMLRAAPLYYVERPVGIETRLSEDPVADNLAELAFGARQGARSRIDPRSKIGALYKIAAVKPTERQAEFYEIVDMRQRFGFERQIGDQHAQGVHDQRGIAQPVEKIIRVRIVGGNLRRRQNRSRQGSDRLAEAAPLLDEFRRRNRAQHGRRGKSILPRHPFGERFDAAPGRILVRRGRRRRHLWSCFKCGLWNPSRRKPS